MYPVLEEGVTLRAFRRECSHEMVYCAENPQGREFEISRKLYRALMEADGTKPLALPGGGKGLLPQLKRCGLVRTSRLVRESFLLYRWIVFPISHRPRGVRFCRMVNALLPWAALGLLALGAAWKQVAPAPVERGLSMGWYCAMILLSMVLHEAGHLAAGLALGFPVSDTGILLAGVFPIGAYVAHQEKEDASPREQIQFSLAGVEMNLLLSGVFLLLSGAVPFLGHTLAAAANVNVVLAMVNMLPARGLDGEHALSALLGVESAGEAARACLKNPRRRQRLLRAGPAGWLSLGLMGFTCLARGMVWLLLGLDVAAVVWRFWLL